MGEPPRSGAQPGLNYVDTPPSIIDTDGRHGPEGNAQSAPEQQIYPAQPLIARTDAFNMNVMGTALPAASGYPVYGPSQHQRFSHAPPVMGYQVPGLPQYNAQNNMNNHYHLPMQNHHQQAMYAQGQAHAQNHQAAIPMHAPYQDQAFLQQNHHAAMNHQAAMSPYYQHALTAAHNRGITTGLAQTQYAQKGGLTGTGSHSDGTNATSQTSNHANRSSVVRGPPRKPRQSGHAIWIGNLPPQTDLMSLVEHVCRETVGLESLFLISKSNCAFANFKDEAACSTAQSRIHDSRFQTVRLVSRLRRAGAEKGTTGGGAGIVSGSSLGAVQADTVKAAHSPENDVVGESEDKSGHSKDKYFIVKSLTVEDLELSVRNGIWATQAHNEEALNKAFEVASHVYLIFSANKSGEYFGYARMASRINDDPAAAVEFAPKAVVVEDSDLPRATPTAATEHASSGRIIDDFARGTIFWEVDRDDDGDEEEDQSSIRSEPDDESASKAWGKPFKLEWLSTTKLPFYRTRGLRNPWNSNREVKIARDGTELETMIGRRLVALFHRPPSPGPAPPHVAMGSGYGGAMRPY